MKKSYLTQSLTLALAFLMSITGFAAEKKMLQVFQNGTMTNQFELDSVDYIEINAVDEDDVADKAYVYMVGNQAGWVEPSEDSEAVYAPWRLTLTDEPGVYAGTFDFADFTADEGLLYCRFYSSLQGWGAAQWSSGTYNVNVPCTSGLSYPTVPGEGCFVFEAAGKMVTVELDTNNNRVTFTSAPLYTEPKLDGEWIMTSTNYFDDTPSVNSLTFATQVVNANGHNAAATLGIFGWNGMNSLGTTAYNIYGTASAKTVLIPYGTVMGQLNFTGIGVADVVLMGVDEGYLVRYGVALGNLSDDNNTITFNPSELFIYGVFVNGEYQGMWDGELGVTMTRSTSADAPAKKAPAEQQLKLNTSLKLKQK